MSQVSSAIQSRQVREQPKPRERVYDDDFERAVIRAGGLGVFIFRGIARTSNDLVLMGALAIAVIALFIDFVFSLIERYSVSPGLVPRKQRWRKRRVEKPT